MVTFISVVLALLRCQHRGAAITHPGIYEEFMGTTLQTLWHHSEAPWIPQSSFGKSWELHFQYINNEYGFFWTFKFLFYWVFRSTSLSPSLQIICPQSLSKRLLSSSEIRIQEILFNSSPAEKSCWDLQKYHIPKHWISPKGTQTKPSQFWMNLLKSSCTWSTHRIPLCCTQLHPGISKFFLNTFHVIMPNE